MDYKDAVRFRMTFGKYKGEEMGDVPDWYLEWLVDNVSDPKVVEAASECRWPGSTVDKEMGNV